MTNRNCLPTLCPFCDAHVRDLTNHLESNEFTSCTLKQQSLCFSNSGLYISKAKETDVVVNHDDDQDDNMSLLDHDTFSLDDEQQSSKEEKMMMKKKKKKKKKK
jgi:hypothetical protein